MMSRAIGRNTQLERANIAELSSSRSIPPQEGSGSAIPSPSVPRFASATRNAGTQMRNWGTSNGRKWGRRCLRISWPLRKPFARPWIIHSEDRKAKVPRYTARAHAGHPSAARITNVTPADCMGDVVRGRPERTIISRKSHGSVRNKSLTSMSTAATAGGLNAAAVPTPAAIEVVTADAAAAPARPSNKAAATRTVRSRPKSSVPVQCCFVRPAIAASRS